MLLTHLQRTDRGLNALLAKKVEAVLDHGWLLHGLHADCARKVVQDWSNLWYRCLNEILGLQTFNQTWIAAHFRLYMLVQLLIALIHYVNCLR